MGLALKKRWKLGELEAGRKDCLRRSLSSSMVLLVGTQTVVDSPVIVRTWISRASLPDILVFFFFFFFFVFLLRVSV
jgi:hypothetical protein